MYVYTYCLVCIVRFRFLIILHPSPAIVGGLILLVNMGPGMSKSSVLYLCTTYSSNRFRWIVCRREEEDLLSSEHSEVYLHAYVYTLASPDPKELRECSRCIMYIFVFLSLRWARACFVIADKSRSFWISFWISELALTIFLDLAVFDKTCGSLLDPDDQICLCMLSNGIQTIILIILKKTGC